MILMSQSTKSIIPRIRWSDFEKNKEYRLILVKANTGKRFKGLFVQFDAFFETDKGKRVFELVLPIEPVLRAFDKIPVKIKNSQYIKIRFKKVDKGQLDIIEMDEWEK